MSAELKLCPFTGDVPKTSLWTPSDGEHRDFARGAWIFFIRSSVIEISGSSMTSESEAKERAIAKWNARADLSQATVAAALKSAAEICAGFAAICTRSAAIPHTHPENVAVDNNRAVTAEHLAEAIRALITPDQRTALQAAIDAAKAEARAEDAAKIAQIADGYDEGGDRAIATGIRTVLACIYQIGAKP